MYKSLLTVLVGLFIYYDSGAATIQDTAIKLKPKSQAWFHSKYGKDDTSKAIIDYFFLKRSNKKIPLLLSASTTLAIGIAALLREKPANPSIYAFANDFGLAMGAIISISLTLIFLLDYFSYSKKQLIKTLMQYQNGSGLPKRLKRSASWKKFISNYK